MHFLLHALHVWISFPLWITGHLVWVTISLSTDVMQNLNQLTCSKSTATATLTRTRNKTIYFYMKLGERKKYHWEFVSFQQVSWSMYGLDECLCWWWMVVYVYVNYANYKNACKIILRLTDQKNVYLFVHMNGRVN